MAPNVPDRQFSASRPDEKWLTDITYVATGEGWLSLARVLSAPRIARGEKLALAVLTAKLTTLGQGAKAQLDPVLFLFKPATVLGWHRELVRRKWSFKQQPFVPRHRSQPELVDLLLRLAQENPTWGYSRLPGERLKLGYKIGRSTVRDLVKRQHVPPAPQRANADSHWRNFLGHAADQLLACAFLTVETAWLRPW